MNVNLHVIHVGKCGGSTITELINSCNTVTSRYQHIYFSHVEGFKFFENCDYVLCLRNPIARAISAFAWRRKLVLVDSHPNQVNRFSGELNVFQRYSNFAEMLELLYLESDDTLDQYVARDFNLIHHLRENIHFYLSPLENILSSSNLLGIICQETLSEDCLQLFGIHVGQTFRRYNISKSDQVGVLSPRAIKNLKRYLSDDYLSITRLWSCGLLDDYKFKLLMFNDAENPKKASSSA